MVRFGMVYGVFGMSLVARKWSVAMMVGAKKSACGPCIIAMARSAPKAEMVAGKRDGHWRSWNDAGDLTMAGTYLEGQHWYLYGWDLAGPHVIEESH